MQKELKVWSRSETVTIVGERAPGVFRVIWHPSSGGADQELAISRVSGDTLDEAIIKALRQRISD